MVRLMIRRGFTALFPLKGFVIPELIDISSFENNKTFFYRLLFLVKLIFDGWQLLVDLIGCVKGLRRSRHTHTS